MEFLVTPQNIQALIECYSAGGSCNYCDYCSGRTCMCDDLDHCNCFVGKTCTHSPCGCNDRNMCPIQFTPVCPQNDCSMKVVISSLG